MIFLFWFFFSLILFHYVGFGLMVIVLSRFLKRVHHPDEHYEPQITFIVAAYNEERVIEEKILNDLELNYPREKWHLIVVSDGSSDRTPEMVKKYEGRGVTSMHQEARKGKIAALNRAVKEAKGEILVFSDANSMFDKDALRKLVRHFKDPKIGGVCGQKSVLYNSARRASLGDHLFWLYESNLKQAESALGSIPTADGEIFAMRRELYREVPEEIINDDTAITLDIIASGQRVIYDKEAITREEASISIEDDFKVKSRMVCGGYQALTTYWRELCPWRSWFGAQFFFHKVLRYAMWLPLLLLYLASLSLIYEHPFYSLFFGLQTAFYLLALVGWGLDRLIDRIPHPFYLPYYYCNVNIAAFKGLLYFLKRQSMLSIWSKAQR